MIVLVLLLCASAGVIATPTAHVVLIIGQSNAIGYNTDGRTAEDVTYPNILQLSKCVNRTGNKTRCQLITAQDPLHHNCTPEYLKSQNIGFGMSFARKFHADIPKNDIIVLVPAARGSTGFVDGVWTAYSGTGFVKAQRHLQKTFELLAKNYPQHTAVFDGVLWHQGEKDASAKTKTWDYLEKNLIPMIEAWRDPKVIAGTSKKTPFVLGNLLPSWAKDRKNKGRLSILVALQLVTQFVPYTGLAPTQGLVGDASEGVKAVHFSAKSQRILGKRYYEAWKAAKLNNEL